MSLGPHRESSRKIQGRQAHLNSFHFIQILGNCKRLSLGNQQERKEMTAQHSPAKDKQQPRVTKVWELDSWKQEVLRTDLGW